MTDTIESLRAERDAALAACAELRAALEEVGDCCDSAKLIVGCTLARTDLGRGMVAVPREVMERCRRGATTGFSMSSAGDAAWAELAADLDALLDGGKGRG